MLFASDLDRTLIYSKRAVEPTRKDIECVETYYNKPLSFMLPSVMSRLKNLPKNITFVPTTTRSARQFARLHYFSQFDYSIIDNGGTILYKGEPLKEWENLTNKFISESPYSLETICELLNDSHRSKLGKKATVVDGKFIYTVVDNNLTEIQQFLEWYLDKDYWYYSLYYNKLYIFPKCVEKSLAVKYLKQRLGETFTICSGDGDLDINMLLSADVAITPKHGRVWRKYNVLHADTIVVPEGIIASEHIIDSVYALKSRY